MSTSKKGLISLIILFQAIASFGQIKTSFGHQHIVHGEEYRKYLDYGNAIHSYEKGIQRFSDILGTSHSLVSINYINLGETFLEIGDLPNAKLYCESGLYNIENQPHWEAAEAKCYECLGQVAQQEQQYDEALIYFQKATVVHQKIWDEENSFSSPLYLLLGKFYIETNRIELAQYYLKKVKQLNLNGTDIEEREYLGEYYETLAKVQIHEEKLDSAIFNYNEALSIYKEIYGEKYPSIARVNLELGNLNYKKKSYDNALSFYKISHNSFQDYRSKKLKIVHLDTCRCNPILVASLVGKAMAFEQKYYTNRIQNDLNLALSYYQQATDKAILAVKYFGKEANQRRQIIEQNQATFVGGIRVSQLLYQLTKDEKYISAAFYIMSNYKGLTLQIEQKQANFIRNEIPENILQEGRMWKDKLITLEEKVYEARVQNLSSLEKLKQNLAETRTDYATYLRSFRNAYHYIADSVFSSKLIEFDDVSGLLNEEAALLNYVIDQSTNQLYILSFSDKEKDFQTIQLPKTFSKDIQKFHTLLQSTLLPRRDKKELFTKKSNEFYQLLITPLSDFLQNKKRLVIIRDGALHLLPFEVLLENNQMSGFSELDYFVRKFKISYHYSTGLWSNSLEQVWQGESNSLLAFAPVFDNQKGRQEITNDDNHIRCYIRSQLQVPLHHTEKEVKTIYQTLGNTANSSVLLREEASEAQFKAQLKEPHRFVHIATHSFANFDYAQFSGIACFSKEYNGETDPMMYINEIENLTINADLVVLSSCESGIGQLIKGEGLLGLNRSFLYAGVPNTIFSLWKVQDEATAILMIDFYKNVKSGMGYAAALRQAKLNMLSNPKIASPSFWSSFILMGR